jgi:hypothetical protein
MLAINQLLTSQFPPYDTDFYSDVHLFVDASNYALCPRIPIPITQPPSGANPLRRHGENFADG